MYLPNFNIKKFLKYCFYVLCIVLLCNSCNAKAWTDLSNDYIVNYTNDNNDNIGTFLIKGDFTEFDSLITTEFSNTNFNSYYSSVKSVVINQLGYASWDLFVNDYYYITDLWFTPLDNYTDGRIEINFYWCKKDSANASLFNLSMATTTRSSSTPTISTNLTYYTQFGAIYRQGNGLHFTRNVSDLSLGAGNRYYNWEVGLLDFSRTCSSSNLSCNVRSYNSFTKTLTLNFSDTEGRFIHYVDSNKEQLDLYFAKVNVFLQSNDYLFQRAILGGNINNIYSLVTPIATNVLGPTTSFETANIFDLGNNSYGINTNFVSNIFLDWASQTNSNSSIDCPSGRAFINDTCYLYATDVENFDVNNTNVSNSALWLIGGNNSLNFDSSKYYVLTFRVYSQYNLGVWGGIYHTASDTTDRNINIIDRYYTDGVMYKDISLVIQPTHSGTDYLSLVNIIFVSLDNFTTSLNDNFNFGIFRTLKLTEYSTLPTQSDVENEITNNSLTDISNADYGNFFTNFTWDDHGLSPIILYPLNFANSFSNYTCSPISLPIPHLSNVSLPCVSTFMTDNFNSIWQLYKVIFNGLVIYRLLVGIYSSIKNAATPDNDKIEVVDL